MKFAGVILLATLSLPAFADYFGCELRVNQRRIDAEAEYHAMDVAVELDGYRCTAEIVADRWVIMQITAADGARAVSEGRFFTATGRLENGDDVVTCACGLR
jgi:hypothetical protein